MLAVGYGTARTDRIGGEFYCELVLRRFAGEWGFGFGSYCL